MTKECKQQFTLRITQANPTQLVVILYEMLLCYLDEAKEALEIQDKTAFTEATRKARGCINELLSSLHVEYEVAQQMQKLYLFCIRRLATATRKKDKAPLQEVQKVLKPLRDAYAEIAGLNTSEPVMKNAQTIYTGLTYGKTASLKESLTDGESGRGMFV